MGRASSSKKVSRAASTGGGRTGGVRRPYAWYGAVAMVVILGFAGILFSRAERRDEFAAGSGSIAPVAGRDHWHSAVGWYLCDAFAPDITDQSDPKGIHTHADGVLHIHPAVPSAAGNNATLGEFADAVDMTLSDSEIKLPGGKSYKEGDTKCGDQAGEVQVRINGDEVVTNDIRGIKFTDRQLLTVAFAPKGADLPKPPSEAMLNNLTDLREPLPATTVPGTDTTTTTVAGAATDATTTTVAGGPTTTGRP